MNILVEIGADLEHGEGAAGTALHGAAGAHHVDHVRRLIAHGAKVDALDRAGFSPLESALCRCANPDIASTAVIAGMLLDAGARRTSRSSDLVARIGTNFEFHRTAFNRDLMEAASKAADYVRDAFGCLVLLVHHCGVDASRPRAVKVATWREALFSRGVLNREAKNPREDFSRIKRALLARHLAGERDGLVWAENQARQAKAALVG